MKTSSEIRQLYLDYFKQQNHRIVPSAPIVVKDDPTLLFTNAGMNQFKDNFLGIKEPLSPRIADTQKCLRASGKHNDLEDVGHDTYHHTMFEMLGNWSFGDYYKEEAINWAWDLLTRVYGIPEDRLYATIFGGDADDHLSQDDEAQSYWAKLLPAERILPFGKKDNFWEMGDTGPCGPCSEIHVDLRPDADRKKVDGATLVNMDDPRVVEVWNLVFMEFNRQADKSLLPLPNKSVDTGMGFERLCMVLQGVEATYDTDLFKPFKDFLEKEMNLRYGDSNEISIAMRVVMDHIRAITFAISDGQSPSNVGAGYVIRRILRRASRYAYQFLGKKEPFLYKMVPIMVQTYGETFPEVKQQADFVGRMIMEEEKSFLRTLDTGIKRFEDYVEKGNTHKVIDGEFAFRLYDTYGFPLDLTQLMAREMGWTVDEKGYDAHMKKRIEDSKQDAEVKTGDWVQVNAIQGITQFLGYEQTEAPVQIARYRTQETSKGKVYQVVLDQTPFYAEGGGQVGDIGVIFKGNESLKVIDTRKENDLIIHFTESLPENPRGEWTAQVDAERRRLIKANHSATHLLHAALRKVLGPHVEQRGSLVSDSVLRFDFSHMARLTPEEIREIEEIVNQKIAEGISLDERREVPLEKAREMGAMALFGEKYGETVRVIVFDPEYSIELCGGIHVGNTRDIRLFKIKSEGSISAGIRRIEALTSDGAIAFMNEKATLLDNISDLLKNPADLLRSLEDLLQRNKDLEKKIGELNKEMVGNLQEDLKGKVRNIDGVNLLSEVVEVPDSKELKALAFNLKNSLDNAVIVLGASINGKPQINVIVSDELAAGGKFHAGKMVRELAAFIKGGGGGQPHFASAGGNDPEGLQGAISKAEDLVKA